MVAAAGEGGRQELLGTVEDAPSCLSLSSTNTGGGCPHSQEGRAGIQNSEMQKRTLEAKEGGEENPQN